jgi:hypothetical protein
MLVSGLKIGGAYLLFRTLQSSKISLWSTASPVQEACCLFEEGFVLGFLPGNPKLLLPLHPARLSSRLQVADQEVQQEGFPIPEVTWSMTSKLQDMGNMRGPSKIKLKKVNKKRTVTARGVIIFLNISRHPLWICLHCCLHQYKTQKAVATAMAVIVLLTPAKNLKKVFGCL